VRKSNTLKENHMQTRLWTIPLLLGAAALCGYGLIASSEPGVSPGFRIAYAAGLALCLVACVATWIVSGKR
jgi:hypothetical protein